jgi:hypothetical protein
MFQQKHKGIFNVGRREDLEMDALFEEELSAKTWEWMRKRKL